ncbi:MAG: TIGR04283 family arsenosugar biosynthesis glycosyltransferase [Paracoccaceae bacterium]|nr:TIGR04283 family arsenosugar biosynthesis glycosyltransferase [Paracoccaceae bacterium]
MPAPLSVIVPTLNAAAGLPGMAAALGEGLDAGLIAELVIADGGSTDGTRAMADALGARFVDGAASRGGQLASGVAASRAPWLLLLHADTELAPGWAAAARGHIEDFPDRAGYFALAFRAAGFAPRIVETWGNLRARLAGLPYGDQGLLVSRALLDAVGGVPQMPLMEDVALARALKGRLRALPGTARTSAVRYEREGWVRRSFANAATMAGYLAGVPPERLARRYRSGD